MSHIFLFIEDTSGGKEAINLDDIVRIYASPETPDEFNYSFIQFRHNPIRPLPYVQAVKLIQAIQDLS